MGPVPLPTEAWALALARLPQMGPARLRALLGRHGPEEAWCRVSSGTADPELLAGPRGGPGLARTWRRATAGLDPAELWRAHVEAGVGVAALGSPAIPAPLASDDEPPGVLCWQGDLDHLAGARVAVVGTRRATRYGLDVAHELGRVLSSHGVAVVSGLALGIDGAAHAGSLSADAAPPVAVVGSGLDHVYPRRHAALWRRVAAAGVVLSEHPLGVGATAWHFPARNRLIAALADVVVVVESRATGGALGTATEAARRGVPVLAVPGPVNAPSSDGTNQLLFDGCAPARGPDDVLLALGRGPGCTRPAAETRPPATGDAATVLAGLTWGPVAVEQVVADTGLGLGRAALALEQLEGDGWIARRDGWIERLGRPAAPR
jgi:DNA processing protein